MVEHQYLFQVKVSHKETSNAVTFPTFTPNKEPLGLTPSNNDAIALSENETQGAILCIYQK